MFNFTPSTIHTTREFVHIVLLLDESASMECVSRHVIAGVNGFIDKQKQIKGKCTMTIIKFNNMITPLCVNIPIEQVPHLQSKDYEPEMTTALNDAIGYAIESHKTDPNVVMVILTDGYENASSKFDVEYLNRIINIYKQAPYSWKFIYLAADLSLQEQGESLGIGNSKDPAGDVNVAIDYNNLEDFFTNALNLTVSDYRSS